MIRAICFTEFEPGDDGQRACGEARERALHDGYAGGEDGHWLVAALVFVLETVSSGTRFKVG